jgi:hypothetical protein
MVRSVLSRPRSASSCGTSLPPSRRSQRPAGGTRQIFLIRIAPRLESAGRLTHLDSQTSRQQPYPRDGSPAIRSIYCSPPGGTRSRQVRTAPRRPARRAEQGGPRPEPRDGPAASPPRMLGTAAVRSAAPMGRSRSWPQSRRAKHRCDSRAGRGCCSQQRLRAGEATQRRPGRPGTRPQRRRD